MRGAWKAHGDDPDVGALFAQRNSLRGVGR
jgi:hypothetical protein